MRTIGYVEIAAQSLAARCAICGKTIAYPIGSPISPEAWKVRLRDFIAKHAECIKP